MYELKYHLQVHIGTNKEKSSHSRATDLEFIRWRATVFGTDGQRILAAARTRSFAVPNIERDSPTLRLHPYLLFLVSFAPIQVAL